MQPRKYNRAHASLTQTEKWRHQHDNIAASLPSRESSSCRRPAHGERGLQVAVAGDGRGIRPAIRISCSSRHPHSPWWRVVVRGRMIKCDI